MEDYCGELVFIPGQMGSHMRALNKGGI
jgi:hypothetical protein